MTDQLLLYWLSWSWSFSTKFVAVKEDQYSQHYDTYDADNNSGFCLIHNCAILIETWFFCDSCYKGTTSVVCASDFLRLYRTFSDNLRNKLTFSEFLQTKKQPTIAAFICGYYSIIYVITYLCFKNSTTLGGKSLVWRVYCGYIAIISFSYCLQRLLIQSSDTPAWRANSFLYTHFWSVIMVCWCIFYVLGHFSCEKFAYMRKM